MTSLIQYNAARHALAVCKQVDEVKDWADKAAAMQAYGRMAKDKGLEVDAAEIRIRAERRLGELIGAQKAGPGLNKGNRYGGSSEEPPSPTLADAGIDKKLSSRAQNIAAVSEAEFEKEIGDWRERVKAEGARVSARLDASGAKAATHEPDEPPMVDDPAEAEQADLAEAQFKADWALFYADDANKHAADQIRQLTAEVVGLRSRLTGLMNELAVARKTVKRERARAEKAEKALKEKF